MINPVAQDKQEYAGKYVLGTLAGGVALPAIGTTLPKYIFGRIYDRHLESWVKIPETQVDSFKSKLEETRENICKNYSKDKQIQIKYFVKGRKGGSFSYVQNAVKLHEKRIGFGFHELAHGKDFIEGKLMPLIKADKHMKRYIGTTLPILAVCSKNFEEKDGEKLNFFQKSNNFIRNNIGKIVFLASLPLLIREGRANYIGGKLAKQAKLTAESDKAVKNAHLASNMSYLIASLMPAFAAAAAVGIKDMTLNSNILRQTQGK